MSEEPAQIDVVGYDGRVLATTPILRVVTLRGIPGFAIHEYAGCFRVSHIETGALLAYGDTDGEAFTRARVKYSSEQINIMIAKTRRELVRLRGMRKEEG